MAGDGEIGNLAGYIGDAIRRGMSQNATEAMLRAPRSEGGAGVRGSHAFLRSQIQEVRATLAAHPDVSSLPRHSTIDPAHYSAWNARGRGAYVGQVEVNQFSPTLGINIKLPWTVRSDVPLTPAEIEQRAIDEAAEGVEAGSAGEDVRIESGVLTGLHYATGATQIDPY